MPVQPYEARRIRNASFDQRAHLSRYLAEWGFKWNTRKTSDAERAAFIAKGIEGKRLTYRRIGETANA